MSRRRKEEAKRWFQQALYDLKTKGLSSIVVLRLRPQGEVRD